MKKLLAVLLAVLMVLTLGACSSKTDTESGPATTDEKVTATITVWGPSEDQSEEYGNWLKTECEKFAAEHPEWELTFEYGVCAEGDAATQVTADPEAAADVYMFANDQIGTLLNANAIAELGGSTLEQIKANNSDAVVNSVTYNGGVYGVPFTGNTWYMFYNKSVFTEEDVKNLDTMLTKGKVAFDLDNGWYIAAFYAANGATFFGADGQDEAAGIELGGDAAVQVTDWLIDAVAGGQFIEDTGDSGITGLGDGTVDAIFTGSWSYNSVVEALGEENVGIAALPTVTINGEEKQLKSFAGSKAIGVNPNSEYPEIAVALAAYLGGTEAQSDHYQLRNIIPTDVNVEVSGDALAIAQSETMNSTSILQPSWAAMGNWWTPAQNMGASILNGETAHGNAAEATEALQTQVNSSAVE